MKTYHIVVKDRQGEIIARSKKGYNPIDAKAHRNKLQGLYDYRYPDLGCHAQVVPDVMPMYNVYDSRVQWIGKHDEITARELVELHDGSMVEVEEDK